MSSSFTAALSSAPSWIIDTLQESQDRFALFLYDRTGKHYIATLIGQGEGLPINEKKSELTWRSLRYVEFGVPSQCFGCESYKEKGYTFHQVYMVHFFCISCIQGN